MLSCIEECKQCTDEPLSTLLTPLATKMNVSSYRYVRICASVENELNLVICV